MLHHITDGLNESNGYFFVEKVRHAIDEDHPRAFPAKREVEHFRDGAQVKPLFIRVVRNTSPTFGEGLCVAVSAAFAHLRAASDWIPGCLSPFNT